ncbi:MAG TPA: hypothetical protein V6D05_16710 [Stenomitos sp.]
MYQLERQLLNDFQRDLPLVKRPFAKIAKKLGVTEAEVLDTLRLLKAEGTISRVGPVFAPNRLGASTLAALAVPGNLLESIARMVSEYPEVNHNYEREHRYNLWFVVTAESPERLREVLDEIEERTGLPVLDLPLVQEYHIDLGFELSWS